MTYPTLEQYNEAFQHPRTALRDPELRNGVVTTTGFGLPLARCGGFALTYALTSGRAKYAVRCFHKQSNLLEQRYQAISNRLKSLRSPYFLDFEFQPQGVLVNGKLFPVVKMAWAVGSTLGEFLESRYKDRNDLQQVSASLRSLAAYLESQGIAHGDIQPDNVMVSDSGRAIQLIDYDGMYVDALRTLGSAELGQRSFQHPGRSAKSWSADLDRFSFVELHLAIKVLEAHPELWGKTQSDANGILFRANDFADPSSSTAFSEVLRLPQFSVDARNFAAICRAPFEQIPTLEDFLSRRNIPQVVVPISPPAPARYISTFPVLAATNYALCLRHVGDRVELIGRIVEVKHDKTRHGKPYVFINFGPWQGSIVKLSVWSEGLSALSQRPDQTWIGKWVSVIGLMEPPFRKLNYSHLSVNITQSNQIHFLAESEAKFRLSGTPLHPSNAAVIDEMRERQSIKPVPKPKPVPTRNQQILDQMKDHSRPPAQRQRPTQRTGTPARKSDTCFIATYTYGADAAETNVLRRWRDEVLMASFRGRVFVACYYAVSPSIVRILKRSEWISHRVRATLDLIVSSLRSRQEMRKP